MCSLETGCSFSFHFSIQKIQTTETNNMAILILRKSPFSLCVFRAFVMQRCHQMCRLFNIGAVFHLSIWWFGQVEQLSCSCSFTAVSPIIEIAYCVCALVCLCVLLLSVETERRHFSLLKWQSPSKLRFPVTPALFPAGTVAHPPAKTQSNA